MPSGKSFPRPARESESSNTEKQAVSYLQIALLKSLRVETHFLINDKTPNHDGYFVLDDAEHPYRLLVVQIRATKDAFLTICARCASSVSMR